MRKRILAITSGYIHPKLWVRRKFISFLKSCDEFDIKSAGSIMAAKNISINSYDAVIIYLHRRGITDAVIDRLKTFVEEGGAIAAFHSATASFKKYPLYFNLLGGKFSGHDVVKDFEVKPIDENSEIFGSSVSFTINDELYTHEVYDDITVHYYAEQDGKREPIIWTKIIGKGKIIYFEPGHCSSFLENSEMKRVILKGLNWAVS